MKEAAKRKILIIDNSIAYTGAFKCALQEAELLKEQFEFVFVLPTRSDLRDLVVAKGFNCYSISFLEINRSLKNIIAYFPTLIRNALALKKICRKENVDVVQVNDFYNLTASYAKMFGLQCPLITYVRFLPSAKPRVLSRWWIRVATKFSHRVICVSDAVLKQMPSKKNVVRLYDPAFFDEKQKLEDHRHDHILLLYLANYIRGKGHDDALEAFALINKQSPSVRLRFVGGNMGLTKNEEYRNRLMERVKELNIEAVVEFGSFTSDTQTAIIESDIVLNFSEAESFSMTCLEASFYGRPVIATKCGGPEEIIVDQQSGILVEVKNISQMVAGILELVSDVDKRRKFGDFGKRYVREKFSPANFTSAFTDIVSAS